MAKEKIKDCLLERITGIDGKVSWVVLSAFDGYGNAAPDGGTVIEICDSREDAIDLIHREETGASE